MNQRIYMDQLYGFDVHKMDLYSHMDLLLNVANKVLFYKPNSKIKVHAVLDP